MDPDKIDASSSIPTLIDKSAASSNKAKKAARKSKRIQRAPSDSRIDKNNVKSSKRQQERFPKFSARVDEPKQSAETHRSDEVTGGAKSRRHKFASARSESVPVDPKMGSSIISYSGATVEDYSSESTSSTASTRSPSIDSLKCHVIINKKDKKKDSKSKRFFIQIHQKLKDWWHKRDQDQRNPSPKIDRRATVAEETVKSPLSSLLIDLSPENSPPEKKGSPASVRLKNRRRKSSLRDLSSGNKTAPTTPTTTDSRVNPFPDIGAQRNGPRRTTSKHFDSSPWDSPYIAPSVATPRTFDLEESSEDTPLLSSESRSSEPDPEPAAGSMPPNRLKKTGSRVLGWTSPDEMVQELVKISEEDDRRRAPSKSSLAIMSMKYPSTSHLFEGKGGSTSSASSSYDSEPSIEFKDEPKLSPSKRPVLRIDIPSSKITNASLSPRFSPTSTEQRRVQYGSLRAAHVEDKFPPSPRDRAVSLSADSQPLIAAIAARSPLPPVPEHRPLPPQAPPATSPPMTTRDSPEPGDSSPSKKIRPKKSGFLGSIFGVNRLRSSTENSTRMMRALSEVSILGQPLERLRFVPLMGVEEVNQERDVTESSPRIPLILRLCLDYLGKDEYLSTLGIFRESGSMQKRKQYFLELGNPALDQSVSFPSNDPHLVASILKEWLRSLPEPLVTNSRMDLWKAACQNPTVPVLHGLVSDLPKLNRTTLSQLILLLTKVVAHSHENKMSASNLGVVVGPCVIPLSGIALDEFSKSNTQKLIEVLITQYDKIFCTSSLSLSSSLSHAETSTDEDNHSHPPPDQ